MWRCLSSTYHTNLRQIAEGPNYLLDTCYIKKIRDACTHPQFISDVMKPLLIEQLMDQEVQNLSGGELQRVALCLCLGKVFYVSSLGLLVHLSSCVCHVFSFPSTFLNTFIVSYIPAEFGSF
jgi:hypothetical protein